eukprot:1162035-Pelagomonas_calceolata.AAC.10
MLSGIQRAGFCFLRNRRSSPTMRAHWGMDAKKCANEREQASGRNAKSRVYERSSPRIHAQQLKGARTRTHAQQLKDTHTHKDTSSAAEGHARKDTRSAAEGYTHKDTNTAAQGHAAGHDHIRPDRSLRKKTKAPEHPGGRNRPWISTSGNCLQ